MIFSPAVVEAPTMRIVLLYNYLPLHVGGIEAVVHSLAREWSRRGHEVAVVGADVGQRIRPSTQAYRLIGLPALNGLETRFGVPYPLPSPMLLPRLAREIRRADVVHAHGFLCLPTLAAFGISRALGRRAPVKLLTEHVAHVRYDSPVLDAVERLAIATLGRASARAADGIVVFNSRVAAEIRALAPKVPQRWIVNGVDASLFSPATPSEKARLRAELGWDDHPRVLFVGRLVAKKGADLAAAAAGLAGGAFKLVMAGPGSLPNANSEQVALLGALPPERVAMLYQAADAFLLPSRGEGFPLTAQEALACGLPVFLGEDEAYAPYLAGAGQSIHLLPPDAPAVAAELVRFLANPARREQARQDAIELARTFSWERAVDEHERFVEELRQQRS